MQRLFYLVALTVVAGGCSEATVESEILKAISEPSSSPGIDDGASQFHDFGTVLAHDQTLRHDFTITNPTDTPIRVLRSAALTPCCSSIDAVPESIQPAGEANVSVSMKAGRSSGRKRILFQLETDATERPLIQLGLAADFSPEWEVAPIGRTTLRLSMGEAAASHSKFDAGGSIAPAGDSRNHSSPLQGSPRNSTVSLTS